MSIRTGAFAAEVAAACVAAAAPASAEVVYRQGIPAAEDPVRDAVHLGMDEHLAVPAALVCRHASGEAFRAAGLEGACRSDGQAAAGPACRAVGAHADPVVAHAFAAGVGRVGHQEAGDRARPEDLAPEQVRRGAEPEREAGWANHWGYRRSVYLPWYQPTCPVHTDTRRSLLTCR